MGNAALSVKINASVRTRPASLTIETTLLGGWIGTNCNTFAIFVPKKGEANVLSERQKCRLGVTSNTNSIHLPYCPLALNDEEPCVP